MKQSPMVSESYERKRRLAYIFAGVSFLLFLAQLYLGFYSENYSLPRASADVEGITIVHRTVVPGDESGPGSRFLLLDPNLQILKRTSLAGDAGAILAEGEEVTAYFATRYSVLREGETLRGADLGQKWEVRDAVLDSARGEAWIFGWNEGRILARKRTLGNYSAEIPVVATGKIVRLAAAMDGSKGPLVAWREQDSTRVNTALYDGQTFLPHVDFDLGSAELWSIVIHQNRTLLLSYHREDRTFKFVTLRLSCCPNCGRPPPPEKMVFADPIFVLGRWVTGLAAAPSAENLLVILTRPSTIQVGVAPMATFRPEPGARLVPIGTEPLWRRLGGELWPEMMLFLSFSMIFLGYTMFRERGRFVLEMVRPAAVEGPRTAEILQRVMAHILDQMILYPVLKVAADVVNVVPEAITLDRYDPRLVALMGVWAGIQFLYYFLMEATLGWTLGKKIMGIRVTGLDGAVVSFWAAAIRALLRSLEVNPIFPFGIIPMMSTRRRQRFGDLLARTLVIQDDRKAVSRIKNQESRVPGPPRGS